MKNNKQSESSSIEYRSQYSVAVIKTICAFLNANGGTIYIGCKNDERIIGINTPQNKLINKIEEDIQKRMTHINKIEEDIQKRMTHNPLDFISFQCEIKENKSILKIDVDPNPGTIYSVKNGNSYDIYIRIGATNKKASDEETFKVLYNSKILGLGNPIAYLPSDDDKRKALIDIINDRKLSLYRIGDVAKGNYLYKYMSIEAALISLESNSLKFVEPSAWEDKFESRFYNAKYGNITSRTGDTPKLFACCMTSKNENEAAWNIYSHKSTGLASRCVRFKIKKSKLREQLVANTMGCSIFFGRVEYKRRWVIERIHKKKYDNGATNSYYETYFRYFNLENYLNLLLLKRIEFDHEEEVRIFIIDPEKAKGKKFGPNTNVKQADQILVKINWSKIIERIDIDKKCSDYEKTLLVRAIAKFHRIPTVNITIQTYKLFYTQFNIKEIDVYEDNSTTPITIDKPTP